MEQLIGLAFALACVLFTVSLPISATALGKSLRSWAIACFLAALVPSVACGLVQQASAGRAGGGLGMNPLELLGAAAVLSVVAYGILAVRGKADGGRGRG